jgi:hypothetical protein
MPNNNFDELIKDFNYFASEAATNIRMVGNSSNKIDPQIALAQATSIAMVAAAINNLADKLEKPAYRGPQNI